jgi:hypothetical protein
MRQKHSVNNRNPTSMKSSLFRIERGGRKKRRKLTSGSSLNENCPKMTCGDLHHVRSNVWIIIRKVTGQRDFGLNGQSSLSARNKLRHSMAHRFPETLQYSNNSQLEGERIHDRMIDEWWHGNRLKRRGKTPMSQPRFEPITPPGVNV